jgi:hypothetical protein
MRQHAIPQNILDVEFKLFTKFTLKEFAYLAIGIGFGGVMFYMMASEMIPGVLGLPVALISSGAGIFLGLVPINDQDADIFVKNYITAITSPTQRVWMNKEMRTERVKPEVKPSEDGGLIPKDMKEEKKRIIGVSLQSNKDSTEDSEVDMLSEELDVDEDLLTPPPLDPTHILINDQNISNYQFSIKSLDKLPGNINIWLCTKDFKPIPNVIVYLKSTRDKILYANRTGVNGYFLTNKIWEPNTYVLEFQHPVYKFPKVEIELSEQNNKLPIKINNI